jgi:glucose/mannose-6-phosphate isomerase
MITEAEIKLRDRSNMFDVLSKFASQIEVAFGIGNKINLPAEFQKISSIIITGLGGSAIGGDLLRSYLQYEIKIPVFVNRNYYLPGFANENTLVIVSSYSGNTEETISAYEDAKKRNCKIICITSGGKLSVMAENDGFTIIKIPKGYQPRCALAYSFFPLLMLMVKLNFIADRNPEILNLIKYIGAKSDSYVLVNENGNHAVKLARYLQGKIPVIYSSTDLLDIVNYRWRCQIEENSECLAFGNVLPEMNHNEIVGWRKNEEILRNFAVIFLKDREDNPRITKRLEITKNIVESYSGIAIQIESEGNTKLERIFDLIYLGDWISYYLAILYKADPSEIENINILKNKLTEI